MENSLEKGFFSLLIQRHAFLPFYMLFPKDCLLQTLFPLSGQAALYLPGNS